MKKLTAGIFSVLMGLVAVDAADAAVASKGYVTGQIKAVNDVVATKVAQADYDVTVAALNQKDSEQDKEIEKRTVWSVAGDGLKLTDGVLTLDGIATSEGLSTLQGQVTKLNGEVNEEGSVKKQIADAIADEVLRSDAYADQAELDAVATAKGYTDTAIADMQVKSNIQIDTNQSLTDAEKLVKYTSVSYVDTKIATANANVTGLQKAVEDNKAAQDDINEIFEKTFAAIENETTGILATAKSYADTQDAAQTQTITDAYTAADTALKTDLEAQIQQAGTGASTALNSYIESNNGVVAGVKATAEAADALSKSNQAAITSLPTTLDTTFVSESEMTTFKTENTQAIDNAKSGAEATAATYTDNSIAALALQAISRVPAECSESTKYCALTTNGTQFVWEVIERDPSEFENGVLKSEGRTVVEGVTEAE